MCQVQLYLGKYMEVIKKEKWFVNKLLDAISEVGKEILNLDLAPRLILITLSKYSDKEGVCWPTYAQISNDSGVDYNHIGDYLAILKKRKFITIKRKYDKERKVTRNYYKIHLDVVINLSIDEKGEIKMEKDEAKSCVNIEPIPVEGIDRIPVEGIGTHYISTTQKAITHKAKELKAFVQDQTLDDQEKARLFDEFWACYPRKEHKKEAYKVWIREKLYLKAMEITDDVRLRQVKHDRWEDRAYIPLAGTYLNGEQWEDEIIERNCNGHKRPNNSKQSYVDQLKEAGDLLTGTTNNVSEISQYMGRKMDKKY